MMRRTQGFTLLEILLVLVIISVIMLMLIGYSRQRTESLQIDRTSMQMQAILNAGLAYYVNNSKWPAGIADLQASQYLPPGTITSPWGTTYQVTTPPAGSTEDTLSVSASAPNAGLALAVAGRVPLGSVNGNIVTATVTVPGQNLNNARSLNFASLYHSGACVPAPQCPTDMTPQIFVAPASVTGIKQSSAPNCTNPNDYTTCTVATLPVYGYRAFAVGDASGRPVNVATNQISNCLNSGTNQCYTDMSSSSGGGVGTNPIKKGLYWRVCLEVVTEEGSVNANNANQGLNTGSVIAVTRCVPKNEPVGSSYKVWGW